VSLLYHRHHLHHLSSFSLYQMFLFLCLSFPANKKLWDFYLQSTKLKI
jgi:hypothetical protein